MINNPQDLYNMVEPQVKKIIRKISKHFVDDEEEKDMIEDPLQTK